MTTSNISATHSTSIAYEKAGILKRGVPGIIGAAARRGARAEIERVAERVRAPLAHRQSAIGRPSSSMAVSSFRTRNGLLDLPLPQLPGRHQIDNAGTAVAAIRALGDPRIAEAHIAQGLKPGRMAGAHAAAGPRADRASMPRLARNLARWRPQSVCRRRRCPGLFRSRTSALSRPLVLDLGHAQDQRGGRKFHRALQGPGPPRHHPHHSG